MTTLHRPIGERALRRALAATQPPYRLHVGAHGYEFPGWINTDVHWRARLTLDVTAPWPVPNGTISHVFGDNMVEHLTLSGAQAFFRHAFAAMQPGGRIRLTTPDVERIARIYLDQPDAHARFIERNRNHGYTITHPVDTLRSLFTDNGHHLGYMWDFPALSAELTAAGFVDVTRCEVGESDDPVLRNLEQRTEAAVVPTMLVVETIRP